MRKWTIGGTFGRQIVVGTVRTPVITVIFRKILEFFFFARSCRRFRAKKKADLMLKRMPPPEAMRLSSECTLEVEHDEEEDDEPEVDEKALCHQRIACRSYDYKMHGTFEA